LKSRGYTSSKHIVTGANFFQPVASAAEKKAQWISPRQAAEHARLAAPESMGSLVAHAYAHCGIAIPRLAAGRTDSVFPRSSRSGFYKAPRLRRSELAYLIRLTLYMGHCRHILTIIILH